MSQAITKTPQMHDIPLSVEQPGDSVPNAEKMKSNSLRRFFKMTNKKSAGEGPTTLSLGETEGLEQADLSEGLEKDKKAKNNSLPRRFHLRMGNMHKYVENNNLPSAGSSAATCSKSGLKNSISSYWNTVFKRNQSVKKTQSTIDAQLNKEEPTEKLEMENEKGITDFEKEEAKVAEMCEEVHTLPISEESSEDVSKS